MRHCAIMIGAAALLLGAHTGAAAPKRASDGSVDLVVGEASAEHVMLRFAKQHNGGGLHIETRRVGAPGASLALGVDRAPGSLYRTILEERQCRFDEQGSVCMIEIAGDSATYRAIVDAFEKGRSLHVQVQNAGNMLMDRKESLSGFTRAYRN